MYFPKLTCLADLQPSEIRAVQDRINARPRKVLEYHAPRPEQAAARPLRFEAATGSPLRWQRCVRAASNGPPARVVPQ